MSTIYYENMCRFEQDLLLRTPEKAEPFPVDRVHADINVVMINPALQEDERQTQMVTPAKWMAHIVEVSDPVDGLVRAAELKSDLLIIDLDTPAFNVGEVLRAVKRSSHFHDQIALAVTTDLNREDIEGVSTWPADVLLLRRSDWLQGLASC